MRKNAMKIYSKDAFNILDKEEHAIHRKMDELRERLEEIRVERENISNLPFADKLITKDKFLEEVMRNLPKRTRDSISFDERHSDNPAGIDCFRVGAANTAYADCPLVLEITVPRNQSKIMKECYLYSENLGYCSYRIPVEASLTKAYAKCLATEISEKENEKSKEL